jgi:ankyrin repeat protein
MRSVYRPPAIIGTFMTHKREIAVITTGLTAIFVVLALIPCAAQEEPALTLDERLVEAAANGDLKQVRRMLATGADVNETDDYPGKTPLLAAALHGYFDIARLLVANGADVNAADSNGLTPLMGACSEGHIRIAGLLLANGAKVNAKVKCLRSALEYGGEPGDFEPYRGVTALMRAADGGRLKVVKMLLRKGAHVNAQSEFCRYEDGRKTLGWTVLIHAVGRGDVAISRLLIKRGANVDAMTSRGWTALMQASFEGNFPLAKLLVQHGADVSARNEDGETAMKQASRRGHSEIVRFLSAHGAKE